MIISENLQKRITPSLRRFAVALFLSVPWVAFASSNEPAGLNLGGTSFLDGFGRTTPGFVYQQYLQFEHYYAIDDPNGHSEPTFRGTDIDAWISLNQFIYVSPYHVLGGALGVDTLLPIVDLSASFSSASSAKLTADHAIALGDLTWGPFLQMPPVVVDGRPVLTQRFEFDVISPTGQYERADDINPSSGFWSLNPFWALTVMPSQNTEFSARLNYLHNFANRDPAGGAAPFRAGDAAWANLAASYRVVRTLRVGVNCYYFRQFEPDSVNGRTSPNSETGNLSLGPGLLYQSNAHDSVFVNFYLPAIERDTTRGTHLVVRWIYQF
jgi:hypothetical protein